MVLSICPRSIEALRKRLSELVVEHEPEYLPQHVDRTVSAFLAEIPPDEAASIRLALPELTRSISLACGAPGNLVALPQYPHAQASAFEFDNAKAAGDGSVPARIPSPSHAREGTARAPAAKLAS